MGLDHVIAQVPQGEGGDLAHGFLVIHQQDGPVVLFRPLGRGGCSRARLGAGQVEMDGRAPAVRRLDP